MSGPRLVPYRPARVPAEEVARRMAEEVEVARGRRSVRSFSRDPVPQEVIEGAIRVAGTAPSGAHRQPWHFVALSDPEEKARLRAAAEEEERRFYEERAPAEWLEALAPLGTDAVKTHLTDAPWVVVVFRRDWEERDGRRLANYYVSESVGIAVGMFLAAVHRAGLVALTHTPSPMVFLRDLCGRPVNEKAYVVIPVGYAAEDCVVPDLQRKELDEIATFR
jgi:nitroreductase